MRLINLISSRTLLLGAFFILMGINLIGQNASFTKIDKSDGLPSNFTYRVLEDMDGFIWICTDAGVCKYDGHIMKCFDVTDGLPDKDIYQIALDELGRIWLMHLSSKIAFIQNDSIHVFPTNSKANIQVQTINDKGNQEISIRNDSYSFNHLNELVAKRHKSVRHNSEELIWHDYILSSNLSKKNNDFFVTDLEINPIKNLSEIEVVGSSISQYNQPTNTFQIYSNNKLYVYDTLLNFQEVINIQLPNESTVLSSLQDRWGNLWVCTRNGLFFQSYNQRFHKILFDEKTAKTNIIKTLYHKEGPIIIDDNGGVFRYSDNELQLLSQEDIHNGITYSAVVKDDQFFISYGRLGILKVPLALDSRINNSYVTTISKNFSFVNDSIIYTIGRTTAKVNVKNAEREFLEYDFYKQISFDFENENILLSNNDSLYFTDVNYQIIKTISLPFIENIEYINGGRSLITTLDSKIYICDSSECNLVNQDNSILVRSIKVQDSLIWLNASDGLYKLESSDSYRSHVEFELYFDYSNLQNEIVVNDVVWLNESLMLGTENGLYRVKSPRDIGNNVIIPFSIDLINNSPIDTMSVVLDYDQRNITLNYGARYFGNRKKLKYEYYLQGFQEDSISTKEQVLRFNNLPYGEYIFGVRAYDSFGNSSVYKELLIKIEKAWYQRPSIYIIFFILFSGFLFLLFKNYVSRVNKRNILQQQFAELELSALQSQMNPHFVFNAMNSIQNLITSNQPEQADLYVTKLANLMRKYLESSKEKYITIEEELEIVAIYLELEKLRFGDKITYEIHNDLTKQNRHNKIPATIVQPFVENALKHGLFHKTGTGKIDIRLYYKNEAIFIEIEDDGVGREKVKEIQNKNKRSHKSTGIRSIQSKLDALKKLDKVMIDLSIHDLYKDENPTGTKVIIKISNY